MRDDERMQPAGGMRGGASNRTTDRPSSELALDGHSVASPPMTAEVLTRLAESPRTTSI